jgi:hypothetical protein
MQWEDGGLVMLERCALLDWMVHVNRRNIGKSLSQTETVQSALSADAKSL